MGPELVAEYHIGRLAAWRPDVDGAAPPSCHKGIDMRNSKS